MAAGLTNARDWSHSTNRCPDILPSRRQSKRSTYAPVKRAAKNLKSMDLLVLLSAAGDRVRIDLATAITSNKRGRWSRSYRPRMRIARRFQLHRGEETTQQLRPGERKCRLITIVPYKANRPKQRKARHPRRCEHSCREQQASQASE